MKKMILAGCMVLAVALCAGCSSKSKTETATTASSEEGKKVLSKYKVPEITGAKKTQQLEEAQKGETIAVMKVKDFGEIKFKFFLKDAPLAVKNFVTLADNGYFDGQTFHRVINDFMIQGGDPTGTGTGGESIWGEEFENEISENLLPLRGSLCMANAGPDTNESQFFIVQAKPDAAKEIIDSGVTDLTEEQKKLFEEQGGDPSLTGSYTVFGQIIEGYDVLDKIAATPVEDNGSGEQSKPVENVVIESVTIETAK